MKRKEYEKQMRLLHGELVAMFAATDTAWAPWYIADADDKKRARLNIISHLLSQVPYKPLAPATSPCPNGNEPTATCSRTCHCGTSRRPSRRSWHRQAAWCCAVLQVKMARGG
jgi:hypothetical protein